jgi:uncharacterized protein YciI
MSTVVYCQDSTKASSEREASYDAHIRYLRTLKDRIRFAGPLATADGARAQGDESVVGSLFVIDEPPSVTYDLVQGDPYVQQGVWEGVSLFQPVRAFGPWASAQPMMPPGRLYLALSSQGGARLVTPELALFGAELESRPMPHGGVRAAIWRAVAIFSAASLREARSMLVKSSDDRAGQVATWALPIAVGTWTRPVQGS